jgi:tRNA pseudouridine55 synthase
MAPADRLHGVLVIDKPIGPTSHDVVARLRRVLGTRAIGHAGTLDPAATGVLVVAVGEATKLCSYLTAEMKRYLATVTFGTATTTLDAQGDVVATAPIPEMLAAELRTLTETHPATGQGFDETSVPVVARAHENERARREQLPPAFSAIKIAGQTAYDLARRGKDVPLAPRVVAAHTIAIEAASAQTLAVELVVSKGYYVRSFARDLGQSLGVPAHLSALRRTASGTFTLDEALPSSASSAELERALQPIELAAPRVLPCSALSEEGERRAHMGQRLQPEHFTAPPVDGISVWLAPRGHLVAIGRGKEDGSWRVERGFSYAISIAST